VAWQVAIKAETLKEIEALTRGGRGEAATADAPAIIRKTMRGRAWQATVNAEMADARGIEGYTAMAMSLEVGGGSPKVGSRPALLPQANADVI
jgi:hypothetical protein